MEGLGLEPRTIQSDWLPPFALPTELSLLCAATRLTANGDRIFCWKNFVSHNFSTLWPKDRPLLGLTPLSLWPQYVEYRHLIQAPFADFPYGIVYYLADLPVLRSSIVVWIASQSLKAIPERHPDGFPRRLIMTATRPGAVTFIILGQRVTRIYHPVSRKSEMDTEEAVCLVANHHSRFRR